VGSREARLAEDLLARPLKRSTAKCHFAGQQRVNDRIAETCKEPKLLLVVEIASGQFCRIEPCPLCSSVQIGFFNHDDRHGIQSSQVRSCKAMTCSPGLQFPTVLIQDSQ